MSVTWSNKNFKNIKLRGGWGQGFNLIFFVKLDIEIADDQQTRARAQTFEGVPDSGCPRDSHAHIWSIFGQILPSQLASCHASVLYL